MHRGNAATQSVAQSTIAAPNHSRTLSHHSYAAVKPTECCCLVLVVGEAADHCIGQSVAAHQCGHSAPGRVRPRCLPRCDSPTAASEYLLSCSCRAAQRSSSSRAPSASTLVGLHASACAVDCTVGRPCSGSSARTVGTSQEFAGSRTRCVDAAIACGVPLTAAQSRGSNAPFLLRKDFALLFLSLSKVSAVLQGY